ncbi:TonB-dependent receptor [Siphonobacter sp. SORGH_AS_0500]|uniref:TonB-dependent receptor n=1 Tax=Siphonobacter sp. SORGH_AS_0500 TaxID=1864824 RepID=UPI000CC8AE2D|nr:TonB-dependent receptor [Siphonobacter sp. SORGH_AS_0500]PKK35900.1 TonB-dependent receptor [Siphonobacter sp. SORGH_AS_0500]PKK35937.1 TonB-dependent receptor [Siphonobacter sp. SORGH_AS_0500]
MGKIYSIIVFISLISFYSWAGSIKGKVSELSSGEPITGAVIRVENTMYHDLSGYDGSYTIKNLPAGTYRVTISFITFQSTTKEVKISGTETVVLDAFLEPSHKQNLQEVVVKTGREGATDQTARHLERSADQVMNIVSGRSIQLSPDLTVANVIQRVSGVSIERNSNGDGQYAIVRGMDKRYNYTLVNGVKIPSPDNRYRYVPLDIFPSDLLDRLEVYKALTPRMEGDAIGGAVNLVMKDAPNQHLFTANVSTGYSELFMDRPFMSYDWKSVTKKSPYERNGNQYNATPADFSKVTSTYRKQLPPPNVLGGFSWGNRFFNQKLGIIVAGSYQNTYRGSNSLFFDSETVNTQKGVTLTKLSERQYSEQQLRYGVHTKLDYRLNDRHKLSLYNAFINLSNSQIRDTKSTQLTIGGYDPIAGNATLGYDTRSRLTQQQILTSTLQGKHQISDPFEVQWSAVYSKATNQQPDQTQVPLLGERKNFIETRTTVQDAYRRWEHNSDTDLAAYLNFSYRSHLGQTPVEWKAGGLYRTKNRSNFYNNYQLRPSNLFARYGEDFTSYDQINWTIQNPRGSVGSAMTYDASEKTASGYVQAKATPLHWEILGGVRVEHTDQGYELKNQVGEDRPTGHQIYTDVLPSLHLKYMPNGQTNWRASYFRSLNRPGFFEIVPYNVVQEEYQERGNPDLKRAIADNIDLRYEHFPTHTDQFMVGLFYKYLQNPIEYTLQRDPVRGQSIIYTPGNFGNAQNAGLELDYIKYFSKWGIKANYTYTLSRITSAKFIRTRDENGDLVPMYVNQTRPLYGQSAHIGNVTVLYRNDGWDAQVAGSYTGERINTVSQFLNNDLWQKAFIQMDASLEKAMGHRWVVFAKANNLLNTPLEVYIKNAESVNEGLPYQTEAGKTLIRRDYYQRSYVFGLRFKL